MAEDCLNSKHSNSFTKLDYLIYNKSYQDSFQRSEACLPDLQSQMLEQWIQHWDILQLWLQQLIRTSSGIGRHLKTNFSFCSNCADQTFSSTQPSNVVMDSGLTLSLLLQNMGYIHSINSRDLMNKLAHSLVQWGQLPG